MKKNIIPFMSVIFAVLTSIVSCSDKNHSVNKNTIPLSESAEMVSDYILDNDYYINPDKMTCMKLIDSYKDGFVFEGINSKFNDNFTVLSMDNDNYWIFRLESAPVPEILSM